MTLPPHAREALLRSGTFMLRVMPSAEWLAIRPDQHQALPWHETVLRPLLASTREAWVYEVDEASRIFAVAGHRLHRERGKYRIDLTGDPIRGVELLWNASGGQRGSIVLVIPAARLPLQEVCSNCRQAFVIGNSTVPHTASAIRLARSKVEGGEFVCCLLSRTNGFEWLSIYASPPELEGMLLRAQSLVVERALYGHGEA